MFASILLENGFDRAFDWAIPDHLKGAVQKGSFVEVPLRGNITRGVVVEVKETTQAQGIQPIAAVIRPLLTDELFRLAEWMAHYYCCSINRCLRPMVPSGVRNEVAAREQYFVTRNKTREELTEAVIQIRTSAPKQAEILDAMLLAKKGMLLSQLLETGPRASIQGLVEKGLLALQPIFGSDWILQDSEYFRTHPKKLNEEQARCLESILSTLGTYQTHLIFGITGSGKTEIYLQAIAEALKQGKSSLVLVPEIALTTQVYERFRARFDEPIALLHHRLSDGERAKAWEAMREGKIRIALGARSAVFAPLQNLGLIIVDEEHEASYKQSEEAPNYHARDVAIMRGYFAKATVVLGSATPSIESFHNASTKKFLLHELKNRHGATLPKVTVVDMKLEKERSGGFSTFSQPLLDGIQERLERGEQTILFINRRGYHTTQLCKSCAFVAGCPHCDVSLAFHYNENTLSCHMCGYTTKPFTTCPKCAQPDAMRWRGIGTELVERALKAVLSGVRTLRIDADTTRHKGSHEKLIRDFRTGKADVLIGTQMVAKGLHFPAVTLVGILNADAGLHIPDFRASENLFQLITQVSGRAGRSFSPGHVILQTFTPESPLIQLAATQDFPAFFAAETPARKMFGYPPYLHLVRLLFSGESQKETFATACRFFDLLKQEKFDVNPVVPAGHAKVKDQWRFHILLKGPSIYAMNKAIRSLPIKPPKGVRLFIDIDPLSFL